MISAEKPISQMFEEAGVPFQLGEAVRLLDIPVGASVDGGVIDKLPEKRRGESREVIAQVGRVISDHHGLVLPKWVAALKGSNPERLRANLDENERKFIEQLRPGSAEVERIAKPFATVACIGRGAIRCGYLPINISDLEESVAKLFELTLERVLRSETVVKEQASELIRWLRDPKNFPLATKGKEFTNPTGSKVGFRRAENGKTLLAVRGEALFQHCSEAFAKKVLIPELLRLDVLYHKSPQTVKQKGLSKVRYYKFRFEKLQTLSDKDFISRVIDGR